MHRRHSGHFTYIRRDIRLLYRDRNARPRRLYVFAFPAYACVRAAERGGARRLPPLADRRRSPRLIRDNESLYAVRRHHSADDRVGNKARAAPQHASDHRRRADVCRVYTSELSGRLARRDKKRLLVHVCGARTFKRDLRRFYEPSGRAA